MGWHWEHLWLKGKGEKGGGGQTEDTDWRHTNASLCPSTADGEGQICGVLPGKPVDETKCCRKEHAKGYLGILVNILTLTLVPELQIHSRTEHTVLPSSV